MDTSFPWCLELAPSHEQVLVVRMDGRYQTWCRIPLSFNFVFLNSAEILRVKFTSFIHMYPMDTQRVLCLWTQHILPNLMQDLYSLPYLDSIKLALGQSSDNIINMSITQYFINNANKYKLCKDSRVPYIPLYHFIWKWYFKAVKDAHNLWLWNKIQHWS